MKKITTTIAALFLTTSLVGPAAANDDLIRLGVGLGAALLGEAMKGGGNNRQAQPRKGDKLEGRVDGKPTRQGSQQTAKGKSKQQSEEAEKAEWAARFPIPAVGPVVETKPTPEQMTAWLAAAPEREAQDEAAEAEMASGPVVATDATTTAAVDTPKTEEATVELVDEFGKFWGMVTPAQHAKAMEFAALRMTLSDSYRAIGLKGPVERVEAEGIDLIDENGKLWGNVPEEVADRVWKAVDLGMKPSEAIPAIAKLKNPDTVKSEAVAEANAVDAVRTECLDRARNGDLLHAGIRNLKCGDYRDEIAVIEAQREIEAKASYLANGDKALASCIEERLTPLTKDQRSLECEPFEAEVAHLLKKSEEWDRMTPTQRYNAGQDLASTVKDNEALGAAKEKREAAITSIENKKQLDAILGGETAAAPVVEEQKPAIDEGETAAIKGDPKPAEPQQPVKIKPKKLDL